MRIWISAVALALVACCCSESPSDLTPEDIATVRATAFSVARRQRRSPLRVGNGWIRVSADSVGITVTSSVS